MNSVATVTSPFVCYSRVASFARVAPGDLTLGRMASIAKIPTGCVAGHVKQEGYVVTFLSADGIQSSSRCEVMVSRIGGGSGRITLVHQGVEVDGSILADESAESAVRGLLATGCDPMCGWAAPVAA